MLLKICSIQENSGTFQKHDVDIHQDIAEHDQKFHGLVTSIRPKIKKIFFPFPTAGKILSQFRRVQ